MRFVHQRAEPLGGIAAAVERRELLREPAHARVLVNRMRRRDAHRVHPSRIDTRHLIAHALILIEKLAAGEAFGDASRQRREFCRGHVRQVIEAATRQLFEDPMAHERGRPDSAVFGAADRMPDTGIDAPERKTGRQLQNTAHFRRLTEQRQQVAGFAERRRHLVHHAARGTGDQVLDLLTQERELPGLERNVVRGTDGCHGRDFERRGRRDALAFRNRRRDEHARAARKHDLELAREDEERARHVRRPALRGIPREQRARGTVIEGHECGKRQVRDPFTADDGDGQI